MKQLKASGSTKAKASEQVLSKKVKEQGGAKKKKSDAIASGTDGAEIRVRGAEGHSILITCFSKNDRSHRSCWNDQRSTK
jgi:hypothetical protein